MTPLPSVRVLARPVLGAVLTLGLGAGALTGCGVAGTNFSPGVAAQVEDETISTARIDELVTSYCGFLSDNPQPDAEPQARFGYRSQLVAVLVQREAVAQLVDEYGVELGPEYQQQQAQFDQSFAGLPDGQRETNMFINEAVLYAGQGQVAIGTALIAQDGGEAADPEAAQARGAEETNAWIASHDVEVNPEFGLEVRDGVLTPVDTAVSVAGEDTVSVSVDEVPGADYVAGLPAAQRCG